MLKLLKSNSHLSLVCCPKGGQKQGERSRIKDNSKIRSRNVKLTFLCHCL